MNEACVRVMENVATGLREEDRAHATQCAGCAEVLATYEALGDTGSGAAAAPQPEGPDPAPLQELVRLELSRHPRAVPWTSSVLKLLSLNLGLLALATLAMTRGHVHSPAPDASLWLTSALLVMLAVGGTFWAIAPWRQSGRWLTLWLAAGLMAATLTTAASGFGPYEAGLRCLIVEVALSLVPLSVVLWQLTLLNVSPVRTTVGALSAGTAGLFALNLHCPVYLSGHLALFHFGPWLLLTALAVVVRRRLSTWSFAP